MNCNEQENCLPSMYNVILIKITIKIKEAVKTQS